MKRSAWAALMVAGFLFARGKGEAQFCYPEPFGVDPVNGNFTATNWVEGDLTWVNNAMGAVFYGVWANTDEDMWFVGAAGPAARLWLPAPGVQLPIAVHFDGFSLQPSQLPGTGWLYSVWGSGSNDVWAVGVNGLIEHWDGAQWTTVPSGTTEHLYAVAGTASNDRQSGEPLSQQTLRTWLSTAQKRAGLPVKGALHILRHTFCSHLAMRNAPPLAIQQLAGHTSLRTTLRYMHLSPAEKDRAIRPPRRGQKGFFGLETYWRRGSVSFKSRAATRS